MPEDSLGDRLARLRHRRKLSQEELAQRAGVSVDLVRKLEQKRRHAARMSSLNALASALDVDLSDLVGHATVLEPTNGGEDLPSLRAIREAITPLDDIPGIVMPMGDVAPPPLAELRRTVARVEHIRRDGRFTGLGTTLPELIAAARAATRHYEGDERAAAFAVLAQAYQIAGTAMAALGKEDAGLIALGRAQDAAVRSDDPFLPIIGASSLSWILLKQGRLQQAEQIALSTAERIEPPRRAQALHLSVWGILLLRATSAAVRQEREGHAQELLSMAQGAASQIGVDRYDYATPFGPTNATIAAVNASVELGQMGKALETHELRKPALASVPPTWRARYLVDVAIAQTELRRYDKAQTTLVKAADTAPEWLRYHSLGRQTILDLVERQRRHTELWDVAARLGML